MAHAQSTLIIINRHAARTARTWPRIARLLDAAAAQGMRYDVHETTRAGDAEETTRRALRCGVRTIAVVGGDGTLSEIAAGFFEYHADDETPAQINPRAALALLPSGTGDDFARGITKAREPLERWVDRLIAHGQDDCARAVDVLAGSVADEDGESSKRFICLNAATIGIGAEVAARVAAQQDTFRERLPGEARFAWAALAALATWRERTVRVTVDTEAPFVAPSNLIAICNGLYAGGGMMFTPDARLDDGCLDVLVAHDASRLMIVRELLRIHRGGHTANPKVRIMRGRRVRIESDGNLNLEADGNLRGRLPARFTLMPRALRVVV